MKRKKNWLKACLRWLMGPKKKLKAVITRLLINYITKCAQKEIDGAYYDYTKQCKA